MLSVWEDKMRKQSLTNTLEKFFTSCTENSLITIKSAFLSLCADIERYFRKRFNINLNKKISNSDFQKIFRIFPTLSLLSVEQFNRFILVFINIRNICAHLYKTKPIYLDIDSKNFMVNYGNNLYPLEMSGRITIYGTVVLLSFLSQKYMIWPFCTSFFKKNFFNEIGNTGSEVSSFQINMQKLLNQNCGIGKILSDEQNIYQMSKSDWQYLNDVLKRSLTSIFFDLEKFFSVRKYQYFKDNSLVDKLKDSGNFDENIIAQIAKLRNCWFHGAFIGDVLEYGGEDFNFTFEFVLITLKNILDTLTKSNINCSLAIKDINLFGQAFFNFYVLRIIECSYKILDKKLLVPDKLEERLNNLYRVFIKMTSIDKNLFSLFSNLITSNKLEFFLNGSKFSDNKARVFSTTNLKIAKIHSSTGFKIGDCISQRADIILAIIDSKDEDINLVNGYSLENIKYQFKDDICRFVSIIEINF